MATVHELTGSERILAAAIRVILREGILALTLDAVAKEAAMSKGGLLYHFASKDALIRGLMEKFIALFEHRMEEIREHDERPRGRWTRAFLQACSENLEAPGQAATPREARRVFFSLLAATLLSPELSKFFDDLSARWKANFAADGVDPQEQMLLLAASDGLLFWEMIGVMKGDDPLRPMLVETLLTRAAALGAAEDHPWIAQETTT